MDLYQQRLELQRHANPSMTTKPNNYCRPVLVKIERVEIAPKPLEPEPEHELNRMDSLVDLVKLIGDSAAANTTATSNSNPMDMDIDNDSDDGFAWPANITEEGSLSSSSTNTNTNTPAEGMPTALPPLPTTKSSCRNPSEEWSSAFARHQQQEREEWERSFVGSRADLPREPLQTERMNELILQQGRALPTAASLLFHLVENQQDKDELFGT